MATCADDMAPDEVQNQHGHREQHNSDHAWFGGRSSHTATRPQSETLILAAINPIGPASCRTGCSGAAAPARPPVSCDKMTVARLAGTAKTRNLQPQRESGLAHHSRRARRPGLGSQKEKKVVVARLLRLKERLGSSSCQPG